MTIKDKTLKPFEIHASANGYSVERNTKKKNAKGEKIFKNEGYFSSVEGCLLKIAKIKAEAGEETLTLKEYVDKLKKIKSQIMQAFKSKNKK